MRVRQSARLIIVSPLLRVLLFNYMHERGALAGQCYWSTPGGGVEPGESKIEAARRELWEETSLDGCISEPYFYLRRSIHTLPDGESVHAEDFYFLVSVNSEAVSKDNWTVEESAVTFGHSWFSIDQVNHGSLDVRPRDLSRIIGMTGVF